MSPPWLCMPHQVNRVSFGMLTLKEIAQMAEQSVSRGPTRLLLAIPFVGKDTPAPASEFSHPDIVIALTIVSYRLSGMRMSDFTNALTFLQVRTSNGTHLHPD